MKKLFVLAVLFVMCVISVNAQNLLPYKVGNYYGYALVIKAQFDDAYNFSEGLAPVPIDGKFGFINKKGNTVIPFKYDDAFQFEHGGAVVVLNGKYGIVDRSGKDVLPAIFDKLNQYDGKGAWGKYQGQTGYVIRLSEKILVIRCKSGEELYLQL